MPSFVYFLRPTGHEGPIKIGHSRMVETRIQPYFFWSPIPLELVAKVPGDETLERRLHAAFADLHSHHEWFHASPRITAVIDAVLAGTFDPSGLPPPRKVTAARRHPDTKLACSISLRLNGVRDRGIKIPADVQAAAVRFGNCPYRVGWGKTRDHADAAIVLAFLDAHPRPPARRRKAEPALAAA